MMYTYNCDFATELVLDFTSLDCTGSMLLNELEEVLDTHVGRVSGSVVRVSLRIFAFSRVGNGL